MFDGIDDLDINLQRTSDKVWERRMELLRDNVSRYVDGKPLRNVVDKKKGY